MLLNGLTIKDDDYRLAKVEKGAAYAYVSIAFPSLLGRVIQKQKVYYFYPVEFLALNEKVYMFSSETDLMNHLDMVAMRFSENLIIQLENFQDKRPDLLKKLKLGTLLL